MTPLGALLNSLEHGLRGQASGDGSPMTPEEWIEEARRWPWKDGRHPTHAAPPPSSRAEPPTLGLAAARARRLALLNSDDVSTLQATLRGGTLLEQRAAFARLRSLAHDAGVTADGIAGLLFEPELEPDLLLFLSEGTGATARDARATLAQVRSLLGAVEERLRRVVDGVDTGDPLARLEPQDQARVYLHLRSASPFVVGYLLDGSLDALDRGELREVQRRLVAWRAAADPRLLPTLSGIVLDSPDSALRADAARALARIDDARVGPILLSAYQTASAREERIALIEAFGLQGEVRDTQFLRDALEAYQRETVDASGPPSSGIRGQGPVGLIAALDAIFDRDLVEAAVRFVTEPHAEVQRAAIRAVGRVGEDNALAWLEQLHDNVPAGLHGELAAAEASILGRAELRGEKPENLLDGKRRAARKRALERKFSRGLDVPPTRRHRFLAWTLLLRAYLASWFGARETASGLCDAAFQADPGWYWPPWFQGRLWQRAGDLSRAVSGYRRALPLAPRIRLCHRRWISPIVQCFVLRAESLLRNGHHVRAQHLLDELWPHDLSHAASPVRLALRRCRQHLVLPAERKLSPAWAGDPGPGRDTLEHIHGGHEDS